MLLITVATDRNQYLDEWEARANHLGYEYRILGMGEKWEGFKTYQRVLLDFLSAPERDLDELVANVDAYDLLMVMPPARLTEAYQEYAGGRILVGGEDVCVMNCHRHGQLVNSERYRWINTGLVMGTGRFLREYYSWCMAHYPDDDQVAAGMYLDAHPDAMMIDGRQRIISNIRSASELEWLTNEKVFKHTVTGEIPCIVHTPFIAADLGRRNEFVRRNLLTGYQPRSVMEYAVQFGRHVSKQACTNPCYTPSVITGMVLLAVLLILLVIFIVVLTR